jgi:hypothetical protein
MKTQSKVNTTAIKRTVIELEEGELEMLILQGFISRGMDFSSRAEVKLRRDSFGDITDVTIVEESNW